MKHPGYLNQKCEEASRRLEDCADVATGMSSLLFQASRLSFLGWIVKENAL